MTTGRRYGLKSVSTRRGDALAHTSWEDVETLLATYYRQEGYRVDHVGTAGTGSRFDGGIDLKLYRDDAYIVVQCKHWNAYKVPHNEVHQLLGIMVNEGATGAILVTSGEFTKAAIEAASRQGRVQLVDGDDLRAMLGPLPVPRMSLAVEERGAAAGLGGTLAANMAERLMSAAEDRIRNGGGGRPARAAGSVLSGLALAGAFKLVVLIAMLVVTLVWLPAYLRGVSQRAAMPRAAATASPATSPEARTGLSQQARHEAAAQPAPVAIHADAYMSEQELRDWKRRNEEAMRILEATTPAY